MTRKLLVSNYGIGFLTVVCFAVGLLLLSSARGEIVARYTFESDASDSVGTADGTLNGNAVVTGGNLVLDGSTNTFDDLGATFGTIMDGLTECTFEVWASNTQRPAWGRIFDFGNDVGNCIVLSGATSTDPNAPWPTFNMRVNSTDNFINTSDSWTENTKTYFAVTISQSGSNYVGKLYVNGNLMSTNTLLPSYPADMRAFVHNYLGRSQWTVGNWLTGSISDFRLWNRALGDSEISANQTATENGAAIWMKGDTGNFSDTTKWDLNPTTTNRQLYIPAGTVTIDSDTSSYLRKGLTISGGAVNVNSTGNLGYNNSANKISVTGGQLTLAGTSNLGNNQSLLIQSGAVVEIGFAPTQSLLNLTTTDSNGVLAMSGSGSSSNNLSFNNNLSLGSTGSYTYSGTITPNSNVYRLGGGGGQITVSSDLVDGSARSLIVGGGGSGGIVMLTGTGNNYSNGTTVANGTLLLSSSTTLGSNTSGNNVTVQSGGTLNLGASSNIGNNQYMTVDGGMLDIQGYTPTVNGLNLVSGTIADTTTGGTLTSSSVIYLRSGVVSASLGGTAGITKTTSGSATLSASNSYTGGTRVNSGILLVSAGGNVGSDATGNDVTINSASTLILAATGNVGANQKIILNSGGRLTPSYAVDQTLVNKINAGSAGVLALEADSSQNLDFSGFANTVSLGARGTTTRTYSGSITPNGSTYYLGGAAGTLSVSSTLTGSRDLIVGNDGSGGTVILTTANTYSNGTTFTSGLLSVDSDNLLGSGGGLTFNGGGLRITGTTYNSTARTINWNSGGGTLDIADPNNTFTLSQSLGSTNGPLTKAGSGAMIISSANTSWTGKTSVTGGSLSISAESALGANPTSFTADKLTLNGGLIKLGSAITSLNSYRGITLSASGGTISLDGQSLTLFNGQITGSGSLTLAKTGTAAGIYVTGTANTYTGRTIFSAGTLRIAADSALAPPRGLSWEIN